MTTRPAGSTDPEWTSRQGRDDKTADESRDETRDRWGSRCDGDTHAQEEGDKEDDGGSECLVDPGYGLFARAARSSGNLRVQGGSPMGTGPGAECVRQAADQQGMIRSGFPGSKCETRERRASKRVSDSGDHRGGMRVSPGHFL